MYVVVVCFCMFGLELFVVVCVCLYVEEDGDHLRGLNKRHLNKNNIVDHKFG